MNILTFIFYYIYYGIEFPVAAKLILYFIIEKIVGLL